MLISYEQTISRFKTKKYDNFYGSISTLTQLLDNSYIIQSHNQQSKKYYKESLTQANANLQLAMVEIYEDLHDIQAHSILSVLQKMINLIFYLQTKELCGQSSINNDQRKRKQYKNNHEQNKDDKESQFLTQGYLCYNCGQVLERQKIKKVIKQMNIQKVKNNNSKEINVDGGEERKNYYNQLQSDHDEFQQKLYLSQLEEILNSETRIIFQKKNTDSVVNKYLLSQKAAFGESTNIDLSEMTMQVRQNLKYYNQSYTESNRKLLDSFADVFSKLINTELVKGYKKLLLQQFRKAQSNSRTYEVQTEQSELVDTVKYLQKDSRKQKLIIEKLKELNKQSEKTTTNYLQVHNQLQIKQLALREQKIKVQEKLRLTIEDTESIIHQLKQGITTKSMQIQTLREKLQIEQIKNYESSKALIDLKSQLNKLSVKDFPKSRTAQKNNLSYKSKGRVSLQIQDKETLMKDFALYEQIINSKKNNYHASRLVKTVKQNIKTTKHLENITRNSRFRDSNIDQQMIEELEFNQIKNDEANEQQKIADQLNSSDSYDSSENIFKTNYNTRNNQFFKIIEQFSIFIMGKLKMQQQLKIKAEEENMSETNFHYPQSDRFRRKDSKKKIAYRIFKPTKVNLFQGSHSKTYASVQSVDNQRTLTEANCYEQNKKQQGKDNTDQYMKYFKQDSLKNPFMVNLKKSLKHKFQKLNKTKIPLSQIKQKRKNTCHNQTIQVMETDQSNYLPKFHDFQIFGGEKSAQDYEKNTGIWPHLQTADKLILDFQNINFATQIQKFFNSLSQNNPKQYQQYINYLLKPLIYKSTKDPNKLPSLCAGKNEIKELFNKLIRFHRINHRNCSHITDFLDKIGYHQT